MDTEQQLIDLNAAILKFDEEFKKTGEYRKMVNRDREWAKGLVEESRVEMVAKIRG